MGSFALLGLYMTNNLGGCIEERYCESCIAPSLRGAAVSQ